MPWVVGGLIAAGSFCLQAYPRLWKPLFGIDVWRHLLIAKFIRAHRRLPRDGELINHLFREGTDYPPLLRVLVALWPPRWWLGLQRVLAPLFDAVHCLTLFAIVWTMSHDLRLAVAAQAAYLVNPLVVMENSNLTTRSFSSLLLTWAVLPLLAFAHTGHWGWLALASLGLGALLLSHRLAVQALLIWAAVFTVVTQRGAYLTAVAAGVVMALVLSRGFYLKVLRGHWLMLMYWRQHSANRFAHQVRGVTTTARQNQDIVLMIYHWLARFPAVAVVAGFPMVWMAVAAAVVWWRGALAPANLLPAWFVHALLIWALGLVTAGMAIRQIPWLRFLGEGERYGEYAIFPTAIVAAVALRWGEGTSAEAWWRAGFWLLAVGGGLLPSLFLQWKVILHDRERSVTAAHETLYQIIRRLQTQGPIRVATIPLGLADALTYFTDCPVLATDSSLAHWRYYGEFSPMLQRPLHTILARYGITHLVVNDTYVTVEELQLPAARELARADSLVLLEMQPRGDVDGQSGAARTPEAARAG